MINQARYLVGYMQRQEKNNIICVIDDIIDSEGFNYITFIFGEKLSQNNIYWFGRIAISNDMEDNCFSVSGSGCDRSGFGKYMYEMSLYYLCKYKNNAKLCPDEIITSDAERIYKFFELSNYEKTKVRCIYKNYLDYAYQLPKNRTILENEKFYENIIADREHINLSKKEIITISSNIFERTIKSHKHQIAAHME
jgi:hypothetical protein